jgi:trimeric autotransporter adhesin
MKKVLLPLLILFSVFGYSQTISTVVGNGFIGQIGYNGIAGTSQECYPLSVSVDSSLNVYYSDAVTQQIFELSHATGTVTLIAGQFIGNGWPVGAYGGDGGQAKLAFFNNPQGIAVDDSFNIYICDEFNFRVRKIFHTSGVIQTIAGTGVSGFSGDGGLATAAKLGSPYAIALDDSGNVYINDQVNVRIRKIYKSSGKIYTIAGTGKTGYHGDGQGGDSATFNQPEGIALDDSGNVFVADRNNNVIRKIYHSNDSVYTVAGTGVAGFSGDGGLADTATLNSPSSVAVDDSFHLYISDQLNGRIRKVVAGVINTVAGTGLAANTGDSGLPTNAALNLPYAICVDNSYNVYLGVNGYRVRKFTNH